MYGGLSRLTLVEASIAKISFEIYQWVQLLENSLHPWYRNILNSPLSLSAPRSLTYTKCQISRKHAALCAKMPLFQNKAVKKKKKHDHKKSVMPKSFPYDRWMKPTGCTVIDGRQFVSLWLKIWTTEQKKNSF